MLTLDSGRSFMGGGSGKWAGEQFLRAMARGEAISPEHLRTLETLRRDEWKVFDDALVEEASIRLRGVADLISAGLTRPIPNALGKTVYEYEKVGDLQPAIVSLDGVTRSENDQLEFTDAGIPLPITHKDWYINLRRLMASRERGEALDTTHARVAGRKIAEETERMLFQGGRTFGGLTIYGYTTHPDRNTTSFGAGGDWGQAAKTGEQILADVNTMLGIMEADRFYGPYIIYVGTGVALKLAEDFKAASDKSIKGRLMELEQLRDIRTADQMPADTVVMVQMTSDVVVMLDGEPLQTVQWDIHGGFQINFKGFQIMVPLVKSDPVGRSGIVHMA